MINRKKRLRFFQIGFFIIGILIIFFTYYNNDKKIEESIISKQTQKKIKDQLAEDDNKTDIFYNIEYSGLDLSGNRYMLKSKEAYILEKDIDIVNMSFVEATFYFKDDTILNVISNEGIYNNKTLDMIFNGNVQANYGESKLFANKAEYSNSESFLIISDKVKIKDIKGTMLADKLFFDIKNKKLKIASFNNNKINANINLKWKKDLEF